MNPRDIDGCETEIFTLPDEKGEVLRGRGGKFAKMRFYILVFPFCPLSPLEFQMNLSRKSSTKASREKKVFLLYSEIVREDWMKLRDIEIFVSIISSSLVHNLQFQWLCPRNVILTLRLECTDLTKKSLYT